MSARSGSSSLATSSSASACRSRPVARYKLAAVIRYSLHAGSSAIRAWAKGAGYVRNEASRIAARTHPHATAAWRRPRRPHRERSAEHHVGSPAVVESHGWCGTRLSRGGSRTLRRRSTSSAGRRSRARLDCSSDLRGAHSGAGEYPLHEPRLPRVSCAAQTRGHESAGSASEGGRGRSECARGEHRGWRPRSSRGARTSPAECSDGGPASSCGARGRRLLAQRGLEVANLPIEGGTSARAQQIRGSASPTSQSRMRRPPKVVSSSTK